MPLTITEHNNTNHISTCNAQHVTQTDAHSHTHLYTLKETGTHSKERERAQAVATIIVSVPRADRHAKL